MPDNPYYDYAIVRDPEMFFGREQLLRDIYLSCINRQCFSLVGTRFIGKSSLLVYMQSPVIQQRIFERTELKYFVFVYVDMRDFLQYSLENFFEEIAAQIVTQAAKHISMVMIDGKGRDRFTKCLQKLYEEGYHTVLLMDTFDKVGEERQFGPNFFSFLRAPATRGWISYVTASIKPLDQISPSEEASPFFGSFKAEAVGPLTQEEALRLVKEPAQRAGQAFTDEEVAWIIELAGRHPFLLQRACQHLFEAKSRLQQGQSLEYRKVRQEIADKLAPHFNRIWKELLPEQQQDLEQEIVRSTGGMHKVEELSESALFRLHICEKFQVQRSTPGIKEVKEALDHLGDRTFLQTCSLATMRYIERRDDGDKGTMYKRGQLVQEFLRAGFEHMKPGGLRNDLGVEWRKYNILHYRYFKNQLANEHTATRLGISRRQYYREQDKAFQALLEALMDLDTQHVD